MAVNTDQIIRLLQKRLTAVREILRLTKELDEVLTRNDRVSAELLLGMRAKEMEKASGYTEEIAGMRGQGKEDAAVIARLMGPDPSIYLKENEAWSQEEKRIYELRYLTQKLLDETKKLDRDLNRRIAGEKSFYH